MDAQLDLGAGHQEPEDRLEGIELPFAGQLFSASEALRGTVDSAQYKNLVLGLVFLKFISDTSSEPRAGTTSASPSSLAKDTGLGLEGSERITSRAAGFVLPEGASWEEVVESASGAQVGAQIDRALESIEAANPDDLKGVLPRIFEESPIEAAKLGELVHVIDGIDFGIGETRGRDLLGRVYEFFIKEFARAEGHRGGEFYTPRSVTELLVAMLRPFKGRVLDPACGSCGLFVQSVEFIEAHGGNSEDLAIYGQEQNRATWRIGKMNLAIHGLSGDISLGDSLLDDQHEDLKVDYILANPPFNMKKWGAGRVVGDKRWQYGDPPDSNANFAWIQHFIHHLAPDGRAGFVLANGALTASNKTESEIRRKMIEANLFDCVVALPHQLFFTTSIPVSLWFIDLARVSNHAHQNDSEILFIDGRGMAERISRTQSSLTSLGLEEIVSTYHSWRGNSGYIDRTGFCRSVGLSDIGREAFVLNPGRYVGIPEPPEPTEAHRLEFSNLSRELAAQLGEATASAEQVLEAIDDLANGAQDGW